MKQQVMKVKLALFVVIFVLLNNKFNNKNNNLNLVVCKNKRGSVESTTIDTYKKEPIHLGAAHY